MKLRKAKTRNESQTPSDEELWKMVFFSSPFLAAPALMELDDRKNGEISRLIERVRKEKAGMVIKSYLSVKPIKVRRK